ncbi:MAG: hypothetical protein HGB26_01485 [Desulfobulbaceae bacterium]|nr:hypothetical protein [Desulfobulbaceae bacterium]
MITIELKGFEELKAKLDPGRVQLAARQSINRAARSGKVFASEEIRKEYNLKAGELTPRLKVYDAALSSMVARLEITGRPMSLSYFDAKQITATKVVSRKGKALITKRNRMRKAGPVPIGVTAQVLKGRTAFLQKSFMAKMRSGHIGVFVNKGGRRIMEKNVITIPSMVANTRVMPKLLRRIEERLMIEFPRQLEYYLNRGR